MSALSVPMLRERVGPRRWAAILVGLIGVVVVLQPSGAGFGLGAMLALFAALTYALSLNMSRLMSDTETQPEHPVLVLDLHAPGVGAADALRLADARPLRLPPLRRAGRRGEPRPVLRHPGAAATARSPCWRPWNTAPSSGPPPSDSSSGGNSPPPPCSWAPWSSSSAASMSCNARRWPPAARGLTAKDRLRIFPAHDRERGSSRRRRRRGGACHRARLGPGRARDPDPGGRRSHRQRDLLAQQRGDPCRHLLPRGQPEGAALRRRPRHAL